jgi:hypothetical protein
MTPNDPDWESERRVSSHLVHAVLAAIFDPSRPDPGTPGFWSWFEPLVFMIEAEIIEAVLAERDRCLTPSVN